MNIIFPSFILFAFLLNACVAPATAINTIIPFTETITPQVPATKTEIPPTPTATAAPTKDPNAPTTIEIVDPVTGEKTQLLAFSLNAGEKRFPLMDLRKESEDMGMPDQLWFQVYVDSKVNGADTLKMITHPPIYTGPFDAAHINFNDIFYDELYKRIGKIKVPYIAINNGSVSIPFSTSAEKFEWKLGPNTNVTTIIRAREDLPLLEDNSNGVVQYVDSYESRVEYFVKMYTVNGNLFCEIASNVPIDALSPLQFAQMALFAPVSIIDREDHAENSDNTLEVHRLAKLALEEPFPLFRSTERK